MVGQTIFNWIAQQSLVLFLRLCMTFYNSFYFIVRFQFITMWELSNESQSIATKYTILSLWCSRFFSSVGNLLIVLAMGAYTCTRYMYACYCLHLPALSWSDSWLVCVRAGLAEHDCLLYVAAVHWLSSNNPSIVVFPLIHAFLILNSDQVVHQKFRTILPLPSLSLPHVLARSQFGMQDTISLLLFLQAWHTCTCISFHFLASGVELAAEPALFITALG